MLDKSLAGPDALKLMHSPGNTKSKRFGSTGEELGTSQPIQRQSSSRCSSTRALISNSEAILTREANVTLIYKVFHTADLVT